MIILRYGHANPVFILIVVGIGLMIMAIRLYFSRKSVVERYLRKIPKKSIQSFNNGEHGRITGRAVMAGNYFEAPLSGRRCMYYHIVVEQYHRGNKGGGYWSTLIDDEEAADVVMQDGNHYAIVEAKQAKCYLAPDREYSSGFLKDATPRLKKFLSWYEKSPETIIGLNKKLRYREGILEPNEKFTVSGVGEWKDPKEFEFDLPCKRVLVLKPDERAQVHLSDDPVMTMQSEENFGDIESKDPRSQGK